MYNYQSSDSSMTPSPRKYKKTFKIILALFQLSFSYSSWNRINVFVKDNFSACNDKVSEKEVL